MRRVMVWIGVVVGLTLGLAGPPAAAQPTSGGFYRVVDVAVDDALNLRAAPDPGSTIVGEIPAAAAGVFHTGEIQRYGARDWYRVRYAGLEGWVSSRFLTPDPAYAETRVDGAGGRVAVVVGVAAYADGLSPLANPLNDAALIFDQLARAGFDVVTIPDGSKAEILAALDGAAARARGAEALLFYFSGHGISVDGVSHLAPVDARFPSDAAGLASLVSLDEVLAVMARAGARSNLVFLDACRDLLQAGGGAATRGFAPVQATPVGQVSGGLGRVASARDFMIVYSTDPNNLALDGQGDLSPFTAALSREMLSPEITINETLTRVRASVIDATDGFQSPWVNESLSASFYFVPPPEVRREDFYGVYLGYPFVKLEVSAQGLIHIGDAIGGAPSMVLRDGDPRTRLAPRDGGAPHMLTGDPCALSVATFLMTPREILPLMRLGEADGPSLRRVVDDMVERTPDQSLPTMRLRCENSAAARNYMLPDHYLWRLPDGGALCGALGREGHFFLPVEKR